MRQMEFSLSIDLWAPVSLGLWHSDEVKAAAEACDQLYMGLARAHTGQAPDGTVADRDVAIARTAQLVADVASEDRLLRSHVLVQYARRAGWWRMPVNVASLAAAAIARAEPGAPEVQGSEGPPEPAAVLKAGLGWIDRDGDIRGISPSSGGRWLVLDGADVREVVGTATPANMIDPTLEVVTLRPNAGVVGDEWQIRPETAAELEGLLPVLVAADALGAAERAWDLAREHALRRVQFGRPLAEFQHLRLGLAEAAIELIGASAALSTVLNSWTATAVEDVPDYVFGVAYEAARYSTHVFGASGYTAELSVGWQFMRAAGDRGLIERSIAERNYLAHR